MMLVRPVLRTVYDNATHHAFSEAPPEAAEGGGRVVRRASGPVAPAGVRGPPPVGSLSLLPGD